MVNIAAIEKSIMTADEKTLKEMAGNIGVEIYSRLSSEARQRLSGVGRLAQPTIPPKPQGNVSERGLRRVTTVKELKDTLSELPEEEEVWLAMRVEDIEKILEFTKRHRNAEGANVRVKIDTLVGTEMFIHPDLEKIIMW